MRFEITNRARLSLLVGMAVCAVFTVPAASQHAKAAGNKGRSARKTQTAPITFGDVTISNFETITVVHQRSATIEGADSTVNMIDAKEPNSKTRLQAAYMKVFMDEKTGKTTRMEAEGNVRFSGTRPTKEKKLVQTFSGTGAKAIYFKTEERLVMEGPVTFSGEQPTADGKGKQSVTGTAAGATYDEKSNVVTLEGGFEAKIFDPNVIGPAPFSGGRFAIHLGSSPYEYRISRDNTHPAKIEFQPKERPKKKDMK